MDVNEHKDYCFDYCCHRWFGCGYTGLTPIQQRAIDQVVECAVVDPINPDRRYALIHFMPRVCEIFKQAAGGIYAVRYDTALQQLADLARSALIAKNNMGGPAESTLYAQYHDFSRDAARDALKHGLLQENDDGTISTTLRWQEIELSEQLGLKPEAVEDLAHIRATTKSKQTTPSDLTEIVELLFSLFETHGRQGVRPHSAQVKAGFLAILRDRDKGNDPDLWTDALALTELELIDGKLRRREPKDRTVMDEMIDRAVAEISEQPKSEEEIQQERAVSAARINLQKLKNKPFEERLGALANSVECYGKTEGYIKRTHVQMYRGLRRELAAELIIDRSRSHLAAILEKEIDALTPDEVFAISAKPIAEAPKGDLEAIALGSGGIRLRIGALTFDCKNSGGELIAQAVQVPGGCYWAKMDRSVTLDSNGESMKKRAQESLKGAPSEIKDVFRITAMGIEILKEITYYPLPA